MLDSEPHALNRAEAAPSAALTCVDTLRVWPKTVCGVRNGLRKRQEKAGEGTQWGTHRSQKKPHAAAFAARHGLALARGERVGHQIPGGVLSSGFVNPSVRSLGIQLPLCRRNCVSKQRIGT